MEDKKTSCQAWVKEVLRSGDLAQKQTSQRESAKLAGEVAKIAMEQERLSIMYAGSRYRG